MSNRVAPWLVAVVFSSSPLLGQGTGVPAGASVRYTLANRVPVLADASTGARQVATLDRPTAVCVLRSSRQFALVRFVGPGGGMSQGYIEQYQLSSAPRAGSGPRRLEQVCAPPAPAVTRFEQGGGRGSRDRVAPSPKPAVGSGADTSGEVLGGEPALPMVVPPPRREAEPERVGEADRRVIEFVANELAKVQEVYQRNNGAFASSVSDLKNLLSADLLTLVTIKEASPSRWRAVISGAAGRPACEMRFEVGLGSELSCP